MWIRFWLSQLLQVVLIASILFAGAGTLRWSVGWFYVAALVGLKLPFAVALARRDPELAKERLRFPVHAGQPVWDRAYIAILCALLVIGLFTMGADAERYHWSVVPSWLRWIGVIGTIAPLVIWDWVFRANTFASTAVRVQAERAHRVISTGPYAFVRHPMYSATILLFPSSALFLGSAYGLIVALALSILIVTRTVLEERELMQNLVGYSAYARRVRHKLFPFVW